MGNGSELCLCGSGVDAGDCCQAIIQGHRPAKTAEELMRSRFTAYALGNSEYLLRSWHVTQRPKIISKDIFELSWRKLDVRKLLNGQSGDITGEVEFIAYFEQAGQFKQMHEKSNFIYEQGQWLYLNGETMADEKIGRNTFCPCGSGKKFKNCCIS